MFSTALRGFRVKAVELRSFHWTHRHVLLTLNLDTDAVVSSNNSSAWSSRLAWHGGCRELPSVPTACAPPVCPQICDRRYYAKKAKRTQQKLGEDEKGVIDLDELESSMQGAIDALKQEYKSTIVARVTPASLDKVMVEVEGKHFSLKQVAQIGMPNPQTIVLNMASYPQAVDSVVGALRAAGLNLNPIPDKTVIKVPLPKMTKELRESLVKMAKMHAEKCKVSIRRIRQKGINDTRKNKDDISEDTTYRIEKHIQQLTDDNVKTVDELLKAKSTELMKGG